MQTTSLPPVEPTLDTLTSLVQGTQPPASAVGAFSKQDVSEALTFLARVVAATRVDPAHLCAAKNTDTISQFGTRNITEYLAEPGQVEDSILIQPTLANVADGAGCGDARLVGDGVQIGAHTWTIRPNEDLLDVDYVGTYLHQFALPDGTPRPFSTTHRATYSLLKENGQWRLETWDDQHYQYGTLASTALPQKGYLDAAPTAPAGDPKAAARLATAVDRLLASPGLYAVVRNTAREAVGQSSVPGKINEIAARTEWNEQGQYGAVYPLVPEQLRGQKSLDVDGVSYASRPKNVTYRKVPFTSGNPQAAWLASPRSDRDFLLGGSGTPGSGTAWTSLFQNAAAVLTDDCPTEITSPPSTPAEVAQVTPAAMAAPVECLLVLVRTPTSHELSDARVGVLASARAVGLPFLVAHAALDADGNLIRGYLSQDVLPTMTTRQENSFQSWGWLTGSETAPDKPTAPAKSTTTLADDVWAG